MDLPGIGLHVQPRNPQGQIEAIVRAEEAGIATAWMTSGGLASDPLAIFAAAAQHTERIMLGTSIIPTFPRHPIAMAQGAVTVEGLAPGRLRLGVGPSHRPTIENMFGIPFERPLQHLREYLTVLNVILKEGAADFHGERLQAVAQLPKPTGVQVLASALRPNAFRLCGELADGAIAWMTPLPYIRDTAASALQEGAERAGRTRPPMIVHVPMTVSTDAEAVRAAAREQIGFYARVPYYAQMLTDAGFPEAQSGTLPDAAIDAIVIYGDEETVTARIREIPGYAVDEIIAAPIHLADDATAAERTVALLGRLAQE